MRLAAIGLLVLTGGCALDARSPAPEAEPRVIAVLPCRNGTPEGGVDGIEFANLLASELAKARGIRALRPHELGTGGTLEEALRAARRAGADSILAVNVTDCDPYDPPRVALSVQLLSVDSLTLTERQVDAIVQSASWHRGAFPVTRERAGHVLRTFDAVFDSRDDRTRRDLVDYARFRAAADTSLAPERPFLAIQALYLRFVSFQLAHRLFERAAAE